MSKRGKFVSLIALAAILSPAASYARHGESIPQATQRLVEIPGTTASNLRGRAAEMANAQPRYTLGDLLTQLAGLQATSNGDAAGN